MSNSKDPMPQSKKKEIVSFLNDANVRLTGYELDTHYGTRDKRLILWEKSILLVNKLARLLEQEG